MSFAACITVFSPSIKSLNFGSISIEDSSKVPPPLDKIESHRNYDVTWWYNTPI